MAMQIPLIGKVQKPNPWFLGLVVAGLVGAGAVATVAVRNHNAAPDISSLTVSVETQSLTIRIAANGKVQPIQTVNLSPKNSGILAELYVEQGDRVQKGQLIARMESNDMAPKLIQSQARVEQAQARLAELKAGDRPEETAQRQADVEQANARVQDAQARLNLATERLQRNQRLQNEGAISTDSLDEVIRESESARANLEQNRASFRSAQKSFELSRKGSRIEEIADAEAKLKEALGNLAAVQVQQDDTLIRAPFSGVVTQKYATQGAFVTPTTSASDATSATSTAIVAIANGLEVLAEVPEVDIGSLKLGQAVEVRADALPDQVFQGQVRLVAPEAVVKQNVTSFQVRIDLTSGQDKLLSGMNVDLTFLGDRLNNTLVVPTVAIVTKDGQTGVLIPDSTNKPEFRPVTIGTAVGDQTQILDGIASGDRVFIDLPAADAQKWMNPNDDQKNTNN